MRAVDEKAPDMLRRKIAAVFGQPVALGQALLGKVEQLARGARGGKRQPDFDRGIQNRLAGIGFDAPQRGTLSFRLSRLKCRDRAG